MNEKFITYYDYNIDSILNIYLNDNLTIFVKFYS